MARPQAELLCADLESVFIAAEVGADRVELCAAPEVGGVTPGAGLVGEALEVLGGRAEVVALVRPRVGGFHVDRPAEVHALVRDVRAAREAGVDGVALGVLAADRSLDGRVMAELIAAAEGLAVTLHRAVDLSADPVLAAAEAADLGVQRILTSGGAPTALEGADLIRAMVRSAGEGVEVVAASGVRGGNAAEVLARSGAGGLHGSCAGEARSAPGLGMGLQRPMDRAQAAALVAAVRQART